MDFSIKVIQCKELRNISWYEVHEEVVLQQITVMQSCTRLVIKEDKTGQQKNMVAQAIKNPFAQSIGI